MNLLSISGDVIGRRSLLLIF